MERRTIGRLTLYFDHKDEDAAGLIGAASERTIHIVRELWELQVPDECRVYVMTSWLRFAFHSAPWPWRIYWAITLPLRYAAIQRLWRVVGGWALRYGRRRAVGVKPPRLLREAQSEIGERVFVAREINERVQHNTCHELVHACTDDLKLPAWLREGLAMVAVDRFAAKPTVREETLEILARASAGSHPTKRASLRDVDHLVAVYVQGYWLTRYLAETRPELLASLLERPGPRKQVESILADELGLDREEFWNEANQAVRAHFQDRIQAGTRETLRED